MKTRILKKLFMDAFMIMVAGAVVFALASWFDVFERFFAVTAAYETMNLDEIIFALLAMMLVACILIFRRTREFYSEITLRNHLTYDYEKEKGMFIYDIDEATGLLYETDSELERLLETLNKELVPCLKDMQDVLTRLERAEDEEAARREYQLSIRRWRKQLHGIIRVTSSSRRRIEERSGWKIDNSSGL